MPFSIRTALRSLRRRPADTLINSVGLTLGLACCALIALHVSVERGADHQHADGERVVRIGTDMTDASGDIQRIPTVPPAMFAAVEEDAAVEATAVAFPGQIRVSRPAGNETAQTLFVGPDFLHILNGLSLVAGDARSALSRPGSLVLTEAAALRLTGERRPLGQTVDSGGDTPYTVTGILAEGDRSHLTVEALASLSSVDGIDMDVWFNFHMALYARLAPGADAAAFARRVQRAFDDGLAEMMADQGGSVVAAVQPLQSIYLAEDGRLPMGEYSHAGQPALLRILSLVGLFVLLVAGVNFVNLATARSAERAREVGVRKAVGADRHSLVGQFLAEAVVLALMAGAAALVLVALSLPTYNALTDAGLRLDQLVAPGPLLAGLAIVVAVGLGAGLYPAFVLSAFRPAETLRGLHTSGREGARLRHGLVVVQFGISTALLVATLVVGAQLRFLRAQDPGFDRERVVLVSTENVSSSSEAALKAAFERVPGVEAVTLTAAPPTETGWEAQSVTALGASGQTQTMETVITDGDYAETLGLRVVAGRDLSTEIEADRETTLLLNESAARALGWTPEEAVGQTIETSGRWPGEVVGVLADYAHHGFAEAPRPQIFFDQPGTSLQAAVRLAPGADVLRQLEAIWERRVDGYPFEATSLDAAVDAQYRAEERLARAFALFAGLAIVVAVLGLFGLAAYTVQRRTREIGVRKVLGATVASLTARLSRDFAVPVVIGLVVAAPLTWWALSQWLDGFAERIALTPLPFALAGLVALAIALATVSVHTIRAASADPVRSLRSE